MESENTTLDMILDAAKSEFLEKGYKKAALRNIAQRAGVTTGAMYGYFQNKEELFGRLVQDSYDRTLSFYRELLSGFASIPMERRYREMNEYMIHGADQITEYMYANYDKFKLILCCSEGTVYHNLIDDMARLDVEATHGLGEKTGCNPRMVNPTLEHMLTSGMFTAFFEMVVHDIPKEEAGEYTRQLLSFYTAGWTQIMGPGSHRS